MAAKKVEVERMSSWAAKRRCSGPMQRVMMGEVRLLLSKCVREPSGSERTDSRTYLPLEGLSGFLDLEMSLFFVAVTCC